MPLAIGKSIIDYVVELHSELGMLIQKSLLTGRQIKETDYMTRVHMFIAMHVNLFNSIQIIFLIW